MILHVISSSLCIGYIIMSTLSCNVYYNHTDQDAPYWVSIGLLTCTSRLTAIIFCQVSPNPMPVQKPILLNLNRRPQRTFSQVTERYERLFHHWGNLPEITKPVNIITSPVLIFFTSMWHENLRMRCWLYILPLGGFGLGVELVLFPDTQYDTHTVLQSGKEIGWSLHRGSQTIQVCPWCKC